MLSSVKFIPRDQLPNKDADKSTSAKEQKEFRSKRDRHKKKKKSYSTSSDSELEKLERRSKNSKRIKEWESSYSSASFSSGNEERYSGENVDKKNRSSRKTKIRRKKKFSYASIDEENPSAPKVTPPSEITLKKKDDSYSQDDSCTRAEIGLEWMLKPSTTMQMMSSSQVENHRDQVKEVQVIRSNSRELNPYFKDNGSGYPEVSAEVPSTSRLPASSVIGDGGLSWRLKALKRAREQAVRDGRNLEEVVEERWGSVGQLAISVASGAAAPAHSHIRAIKERRKGRTDSSTHLVDSRNDMSVDERQSCHPDYLQDVSYRHSEMKKPRDFGSYASRRMGSHSLNAKDSQIIREAMTSMNKFANDGSFMDEIKKKQEESSEANRSAIESQEVKADGLLSKSIEGSSDSKSMTANQLAAKALQLRMKGKHKEAELLMKEVESMKGNAVVNVETPELRGNVSRHAKIVASSRQKLKEDDADMHLARTIVKNGQYSLSRRADDEYEYDGSPAPRKVKHRKQALEQNSTGKSCISARIITQKERCHFCFENPTRPKHLVVSIANFTYLMLPQWEALVEGHCYILPMQHESSSRSVDDNVWEELRNFKKCLIRMFQEQKKEVLFIETVIDLAKQRRHCLIECIPLPSDVANMAPMYFKQAIDEAEDEWSQHNAKKLIDTSGKGLRGSIPKNFPYFFVEFGLDRGFVHVIDDEANFKKDFGLNVVRGLLKLPEEDMYRRKRHESRDFQMRAVAKFAQDWSPYDWTKGLD